MERKSETEKCLTVFSTTPNIIIPLGTHDAYNASYELICRFPVFSCLTLIPSGNMLEGIFLFLYPYTYVRCPKQP